MGFTFTAGLNEEAAGAKDDGEENGDEGVRGPGDLMGRRRERGDSEEIACLCRPGSGIASCAGLAFETGPTEVFLNVSVSAAKLSAVVMEGDVDGGEESDAIEESDEGDLLLLRKCTGRGAGTGGLEARAPWGRSITKSGVCFGFRLVADVEVRDSQNPRKP